MATFYQKIKLLQGLVTGETAYIGPFFVRVDITRRCNLRCSGCRYHSTKVSVPLPGDRTIMDMPLEYWEILKQEKLSVSRPSLIRAKSMTYMVWVF